MFTGRLNALPVTFRVACFRARRSTLVTECYQLPCDGLRSMGLMKFLVLLGLSIWLSSQGQQAAKPRQLRLVAAL